MDSLLDAARADAPDADDETLIIRIARRIADDLKLELPVEPAMIASYQGIRRIEQSLIPWAGCLVTEPDGLVIRVRSTDTLGRQRFTALHEVVHTFFPGFRYTTQYRCTPQPLSKRASADLEVLCDIGASELLLPADLCSPLIQSAPFSLHTVQQLAAECGASLEAAAHRFAALWPEPCLLLRMEKMSKPRDPHGPPKLRVSSAISRGNWPFIPRYKSVPDDHVLTSCLWDDEVHCVTNLDDVATMGPVEVHAKFYPFNDSEGTYRERVLVLARKPDGGAGHV